MNWCTAYDQKTNRMMVIYPESLAADNPNFDIFPSTDNFKNYLNKKYKPEEGDIFSFAFVTKDYPAECFNKAA
jgi:hypothetical protein